MKINNYKMDSIQAPHKNSSFVEILDIYGHTFNLHIFGRGKYKTLTGSIFSLLSLSLIFSASVYFIINLFQKKSLTVIFNDDYNSITINNLTQIPLSFALGDYAGNPIATEGIYSLDVKFLTYKRVLSQDGTFKLSLEILPIEMEKCDIDKHFLDQKDWWRSFNMNYMLCIPPNKYNLTLQGKPRDVVNGWSSLNVYVNKCDMEKQKCLNSSLTDKALSNFVFITAFKSNSIDHYNTTNPFSNKIESTSFRMSNSILKSYQLSLKQTKYKTDNGFILEENETLDFFVPDRIWMDVSVTSLGELTKGQMMGKLIFENSLTVSNFYRTYLKAQAVMANIGGIIKAIIVISKIVSEFLTRRISFVEISNSVFEYKFENKNFLNKNPLTSNLTIFKRQNTGILRISKLNTIKIQDQKINPISNQNIAEK